MKEVLSSVMLIWPTCDPLEEFSLILNTWLAAITCLLFTVIVAKSLFENRFYYAEQSFYDEVNDRYIYWHGHPAGGTEDAGFLINNKVSWFQEEIISEPYFGISKFKYDIFTFSKGYNNYFFYSDLNLSDPVRTNLRDYDGNPVMGAFGAMNSKTKFFEIVVP